jgi:hypothetical protein
VKDGGIACQLSFSFFTKIPLSLIKVRLYSAKKHPDYAI